MSSLGQAYVDVIERLETIADLPRAAESLDFVNQQIPDPKDIPDIKLNADFEIGSKEARRVATRILHKLEKFTYLSKKKHLDELIRVRKILDNVINAKSFYMSAHDL